MSSHTVDTTVEECGDELAIMSAHSSHVLRNSETAPLLKGGVSGSSVRVVSGEDAVCSVLTECPRISLLTMEVGLS